MQTDASADGNLKIRNATSSTDVMFFDADNNNIGINNTNPERKLEVVDTAGSLTFPVAVSNHTDASAGVGAGIAFHLTAGGNARGELGLVYAGNSNSDGTDFVFRPNDGSTGQVERLRIKVLVVIWDSSKSFLFWSFWWFSKSFTYWRNNRTWS